MRSLAEQCPGLLRLTVRSQTLGDTALAALLSGTRMRLASLGVVGAPRLTADGLARALESLPPLTEVDVSGCRSLTDVGLQAMARHSGHTLQRLHAAACPALTRSGVHRALASLSVLRVLDLGMSLAQPHSAPSPATPRDSPPHPVAQGLSPDTSHDGATEPRATTRRLEFSRGPGAEEQVLQVSSPTLEVLSLHGCSRLEGLAVACPRLVHLRLTGCSRLKGHQGERQGRRCGRSMRGVTSSQRLMAVHLWSLSCSQRTWWCRRAASWIWRGRRTACAAWSWQPCARRRWTPLSIRCVAVGVLSSLPAGPLLGSQPDLWRWTGWLSKSCHEYQRANFLSLWGKHCGSVDPLRRRGMRVAPRPGRAPSALTDCPGASDGFTP